MAKAKGLDFYELELVSEEGKTNERQKEEKNMQTITQKLKVRFEENPVFKRFKTMMGEG